MTHHLLAIIDPDTFQSLALKWIGVASIVLTALLGVVGVLWGKASEMMKRQDRQSVKTGSLQEQLTQVALTTPPAIQPAPAPDYK